MRNSSFKEIAVGCLTFVLIEFTVALPAPAQDDGESGFDRYFGLQKVSNDDDWTRHFRVGAVVGLNVSANFNENGVFNVSGNNGTYANGYVHPDPANPGDAYTRDWGYDNASQYNATAQTLTMQGAASYSTAGSSQDSGGPFVGFDLAYGGNLWYWHGIRIGYELGFDLMPVSVSDHEPFSATVIQNTYTFDTANLAIPAAPYHGNGGAGGALFPVNAMATNQTSAVGGISGTRTLDATLYAIRLGPSFYYDLNNRIGVEAGGGPAIGIVTAEYKYNETVTVNGVGTRNTGSFDGTDIIFGANINATVMFHFQDNDRNADVFIGAEYAPMGNASFGSNGRNAKLNFGGQVYLTAGINWPF